MEYKAPSPSPRGDEGVAPSPQSPSPEPTKGKSPRKRGADPGSLQQPLPKKLAVYKDMFGEGLGRGGMTRKWLWPARQVFLVLDLRSPSMALQLSHLHICAFPRIILEHQPPIFTSRSGRPDGARHDEGSGGSHHLPDHPPRCGGSLQPAFHGAGMGRPVQEHLRACVGEVLSHMVLPHKDPLLESVHQPPPLIPRPPHPLPTHPLQTDHLAQLQHLLPGILTSDWVPLPVAPHSTRTEPQLMIALRPRPPGMEAAPSPHGGACSPRRGPAAALEHDREALQGALSRHLLDSYAEHLHQRAMLAEEAGRAEEGEALRARAGRVVPPCHDFLPPYPEAVPEVPLADLPPRPDSLPATPSARGRAAAPCETPESALQQRLLGSRAMPSTSGEKWSRGRLEGLLRRRSWV